MHLRLPDGVIDVARVRPAVPPDQLVASDRRRDVRAAAVTTDLGEISTALSHPVYPVCRCRIKP